MKLRLWVNKQSLWLYIFLREYRGVDVDNCIFLCRKNVERRYLLDNMEGVFLVVDEIIDGG